MTRLDDKEFELIQDDDPKNARAHLLEFLDSIAKANPNPNPVERHLGGHVGQVGTPEGGSQPGFEHVGAAEGETDGEDHFVGEVYSVAANYFGTDEDILVKLDKWDSDAEEWTVEIISGSSRENIEVIGSFDLDEPDESELATWSEVGGGALEDRARSVFGLTDDFHEAGFILRDGEMLDFSGKREGGLAGTRAIDHRNVGRAFIDGDYDEVPDRGEGSASDSLIYFMNSTGAVRVSYFGDAVAVDLAANPTRAQREVIESFGFLAGGIDLDITSETGGILWQGRIDDPEDIRSEINRLSFTFLRNRAFITMVFRHLGGHEGQEGTPGGGSQPGFTHIGAGKSPVAKITNDVTGAYSGQVNGRLLAFNDDGRPIGGLDYQQFEDEVLIAYMEVVEDFRRQGVGKELVKELEEVWPDKKVVWGVTTEEGQRLKETVTRHLGGHVGQEGTPSGGSQPGFTHVGGSVEGDGETGEWNPEDDNSIEFGRKVSLDEEVDEALRVEFRSSANQVLRDFYEKTGIKPRGLTITNSHLEMADTIIEGQDFPGLDRFQLAGYLMDRSINRNVVGTYEDKTLWLADVLPGDQAPGGKDWNSTAYHELGHWVHNDVLDGFQKGDIVQEIKGSQRFIDAAKPHYGDDTNRLRREYVADLISAVVSAPAGQVPVFHRWGLGPLNDTESTDLGTLLRIIDRATEQSPETARTIDRLFEGRRFLVALPEGAGEILFVTAEEAHRNDWPENTEIIDLVNGFPMDIQRAMTSFMMSLRTLSTKDLRAFVKNSWGDFVFHIRSMR